jgi:hypothetical protein
LECHSSQKNEAVGLDEGETRVAASDPLRAFSEEPPQSLQNVTLNFLPLGVMWDGSLTPSNNPREDVGVNSKALFLVDKALQHGSLIMATREMSGIHGTREIVVETHFYEGSTPWTDKKLPRSQDGRSCLFDPRDIAG